jgi:glycolate oxidase FAD binding subunit
VTAGATAAGPAPLPAAAGAIGASVRRALAAGSRLAPRGAGTWWPEGPPDTEPLDFSSVTHVTGLEPADLVVTAGAGCRLDALSERLAAAGVWLALEPPGSLSRSVGGVLASGSGGPIAARYGTPKDQVLGLAAVMGNGTPVRMGGRVVKNVAGFDVAKAVLGSHGAYGVIVEAHLRLHAVPAADRTEAWAGSLREVAAAAALALGAGAAPAALEAVSPPLANALLASDGWALVARDLGGSAAVEEEIAVVARAAGATLRSVTASPDRSVWDRWREAVGGWAVVVRIGADPAAWTDAVALAGEHLGTPLGVSVTVPRGTVRAGFAGATAGALAALRAAAARRCWPVILERAGAALREEAGVTGALAPEARRLAEEVRRAFDPNGVFSVPFVR